VSAVEPDPLNLVPTTTFRNKMRKTLRNLLQEAETVLPADLLVSRGNICPDRTSRTRRQSLVYTENRAYVHVGYYGGAYEGNVSPKLEREGFGSMYNNHEFYMGDWLNGSRHGNGV
jgi:hypothetical protein